MAVQNVEDVEESIEDFVKKEFKSNWAFWLFYTKHLNHWFFAVTVSVVIFLIGCLSSLLLGVFPVYISNWTLYLNLFGITLAFIAFGWFTHRLPNLLSQLADLFESNEAAYRKVIAKWGKFANKNLVMLGIGFGIAIIYLVDAIKYWKSPSPPILLVPWVNSEASIFFAIFYGFLHAIVVPLILGSGLYGMYGVVCMLGELFTIPIDLVYYRRAEDVIGLTGWLLMWSLIGWASIVIFGRPYMLFPIDIPWIRKSGLLLTVITTLFVLAIGSVPLILIGKMIEKAKSEERNYLERQYQEANKKYKASVASDNDEEQRHFSEKLKILGERIQWIDSIPTIPIRLSSFLRVSFGVVVSVFSPFIQDWLMGYLLSFYQT